MSVDSWSSFSLTGLKYITSLVHLNYFTGTLNCQLRPVEVFLSQNNTQKSLMLIYSKLNLRVQVEKFPNQVLWKTTLCFVFLHLLKLITWFQYDLVIMWYPVLTVLEKHSMVCCKTWFWNFYLSLGGKRLCLSTESRRWQYTLEVGTTDYRLDVCTCII